MILLSEVNEEASKVKVVYKPVVSIKPSSCHDTRIPVSKKNYRKVKRKSFLCPKNPYGESVE